MWAQLLSQHSRGDGRIKSSRNRPGMGVHTYNLNTRRKMQEDLWELQASRAAVSGVSSHLDCVSPLGSLEVCHYLLESRLPIGTVPTVSRAHRLGQFAQVSSEERRASGVRCLEPLAQSWPESWLLLPVINTVPSGRLHFREPSSRKQSKKERKKIQE